MSQVQVARISSYVFFVPPSEGATVSRLSVYAWLMPGGDSSVTTGQGSCYAQKLSRG